MDIWLNLSLSLSLSLAPLDLPSRVAANLMKMEGSPGVQPPDTAEKALNA